MKQKTKRPRRQRRDRIANAVATDFASAKELFDKTFNFGDLPRIEDKYAQDRENLISLRGGYADPTSESFAGRRSTDVSDILNRMKGGLEGYTAAENQAIWERSNRDINQELTTELKGIEDTNAGNMVLGAAAVARSDAAKRAANQKRIQNAQDLAIQNIDEKRSRLNEFSDAIKGAEADEFGRGQDAISSYESSVLGAAQSDQERQMANIDLEMKDREAYAGGLTGFADVIMNRRGSKKQNKLLERLYGS